MKTHSARIPAVAKFLALLLLLALPAVAQAQIYYTNSSGIWSYTPYNGPVTITGLSGTSPKGGVIMPDTINGYPVVSIADFAFYDMPTLTSFTIGANVTNIGQFALGFCTGLASVSIPNSVTSIGRSAFYECISLSGVTIPPGVTSIGTNTFFNCVSLLSVAMSTNLTSIEEEAFGQCTNLVSATIPDSVTNIGDYAFEDCLRLTSVIGNGVNSIGPWAFYFCASLTSVTLGTNLTSIGSDAFLDCRNLTGVYFQGNSPTPTNDTTVFANDTHGIVYYVPGTRGWGTNFDGLPTMIPYTFLTNNGAITITGYSGPGGAVTIPSTINGYPVVAISDFFHGSSLTSVTIPNSVTAIGTGAFSSSGLTTVVIPNSVTNIGHEAFDECSALVSVTFGTNVSTLGTYAFVNCYDLASVTLPNSLTSIPADAFYDCIGLTNVVFGAGVTNIGSDAFFFCSRLAGVYFQGNSPTPTNDSTVFSGDTHGIVYYLPKTTGWGATFDGLPTALWLPQVQSGDAAFGVKSNKFGFNINWVGNRVVVVKAATNLVSPVWLPVSTNTLSGGASYFSDPHWTNYPSRYYRLNAP